MPKEIYDAANPKYRCCCGCHVTTGAMIICLLYFFSDLAVMIQRIFLNSESIILFIAVAFAAVGVVAFGIGFLGAKNEKPKWLIPAMIMIACFIIYAIVDGVYGIYTFLTTQTPRMLFFESINKRKLIWPYDDSHGKQTALVLIALVIRPLIGIAFHSWLLSIVYRSYQYLTAKNEAIKERPARRSINVTNA